jgi:N-acetylmuramoyl-L-alanine amidase
MADSGSPLHEGNRVLESIARREGLGALHAFSELHEQIRNRRVATGRVSDRDLFETERFILDEVLQLICDRAQAITQADGIVVALVEAPAERGSAMVCRAAAGALAAKPGARLIRDSEFLRDCLESGRILSCDDCEADARLELDLAREIGARSTVLVPLRGWREQLGVLQAFSAIDRAFTEHDVRCFDLFAELVLSALRPEDQHRRIHWLTDVADQVLLRKPVADVPLIGSAAVPESEILHSEIPESEIPESLIPAIEPSRASIEAWIAQPPTPETPIAAEEAVWAQPLVIPAALVELPERRSVAESATDDLTDEPADEASAHKFGVEETTTPTALAHVSQFQRRFSVPGSSRPGLSVVVGLVAVAALFSAGAWWGMEVHGRTAVLKTSTAKSEMKTAIFPRSVTSPPAPPAAVLSPSVADNLMNPSKANTGTAPLTAVTDDKLAALPKITGVRHWSSSMGSTVVIDMQDQVPYEVHRLNSPERIYFDLHDTTLSSGLDGKTMEVDDTALTRVRVGQPVAGVTRIVLDTRDGANFSVSMESSPYRLVVGLRGSDKTAAVHPATHPSINQSPVATDATAAPVKSAPAAALAEKASDQPMPAKTGRFRIVLDAGHGGWDLGTVGRKGLLEKDLVLDVTQRLGKLLRARLGSEVMFTRTDDTYLPLDQRADIANQAQADLFVSVHANYSNSTSARGVETYYTNLFSAPGSREAEKHDDGSLAKVMPVSLSAEGLHEKTEESQHLAASVQHSLYATLAANNPDIRNRGIKDSAFVVLEGTTMPAILTEISFVSSPADEHNLQSATYRQQIAEALYKGIAHYEQASPHAKVAQLQTTGASRR